MKLNMKPAAIAALFFCSVTASLTANAAAPYFTLTDLGSLHVTGLNDQRQVVGNIGSSAYRFDNGTMTNLGAFSAQAINNVGQIAGYNSANGQAVLYANGSSHNLGDGQALFGNVDDRRAYSHGLNDFGTVVGEAAAGSGSGVPWVHNNGTMKGVNANPGYEYATAKDINNAGQIAGYQCGPDNCTSWINDHGVITNLNGDDDSLIASDINNAGQVVGTSYYSNSAYLYENGQVTYLPTYNGQSWFGMGINDNGWVVGQTGTGSPNGSFNSRAVIYHEGTTYDLLSLAEPTTVNGWQLLSAIGVNAKGDIIGMGLLNGELHGYLLLDPPAPTPAPEPETYALFGIGLAALNLAVRRRRRAQ